jgi:hypothetical protein
MPPVWIRSKRLYKATFKLSIDTQSIINYLAQCGWISVATYSVVIDESGEAGIAKVRTADSAGASPYLTMGACVYPNTYQDKLTEELDRIKTLFKKSDLHC